MNKFVLETHDLLKNQDFDYAVCGGYAIELFLNKSIRSHKDIDISASWKDRNKIINFFLNLGWNIYELCGNSLVHKITDVDNQLMIKRNIFCSKHDCDLFSLEKTDEENIFYLEFFNKDFSELNFIEFLFNNIDKENFYYARNKEIYLPIENAILYNNDIPYLCPELILLYKSTDINRDGYEMDFDRTISKMDDKNISWLKNSLLFLYNEHKWIDKIKTL